MKINTKYIIATVSIVAGIGIAASIAFQGFLTYQRNQKQFKANQSSIQSQKNTEKTKNTNDSHSFIEKLPDFTGYKSSSEKKNAFFHYMAQFATIVNNEVLIQRKKLKKAYSEYLKNSYLSKDTEDWLNKLANQYQLKNWDITNPQDWTQLLTRVDVVPTSMLLAQSANESAWGTSRFAREGNNMFGQWCFTKGCGIVPKRRTSGKTHQVKKFPTVLASVRAYVFNLNTNKSYQLFRLERARLHKIGKPLSGYTLASGLNKYSERKGAYVAEVRRMITGNKLENYQTDIG